MNIFRMHIKPDGKASRKRTFEYCLENNLLGVGWKVQDAPYGRIVVTPK